jgi:hypothetical protein
MNICGGSCDDPSRLPSARDDSLTFACAYVRACSVNWCRRVYHFGLIRLARIIHPDLAIDSLSLLFAEVSACAALAMTNAFSSPAKRCHHDCAVQTGWMMIMSSPCCSAICIVLAIWPKFGIAMIGLFGLRCTCDSWNGVVSPHCRVIIRSARYDSDQLRSSAFDSRSALSFSSRLIHLYVHVIWCRRHHSDHCLIMLHSWSTGPPPFMRLRMAAKLSIRISTCLLVS